MASHLGLIVCFRKNAIPLENSIINLVVATPRCYAQHRYPTSIINSFYIIQWRRVAEWLAHSTAKQKVAGSNPTRASGCKTPSVHPAVKWVPDLIQGRKGSGRRGDGLRLPYAVP